MVAAIAPKVQQAELERSTRKPTESLDAYDYYLRGLALQSRPTKQTTEEALRLFYKAIELDPDFAAPYATAARCYSTRKVFGWMSDPTVETVEADRLVQRAVKLGADDAFVFGLSAFATFYLFGDLEGGAVHMERARALNPNLAILWGGSGFINVCLGQLDMGIAQIEHAIRLSPLDPSMGLWEHGIALGHFCAGRDEDAVSWSTMALRDMGYDGGNTLAVLAASFAFLGHMEEGQNAIERLRIVAPDWRLSNLPDLRNIRRTQDRKRFLEGLRLAGLPE